MSFTVTQVNDHLLGMGHGGTLNKVRNIEAMYQRSAGRYLLLCKPLEVMRKASFGPIYDDVYDGATLPTDFGSAVDLAPQDNRQSWDEAFRDPAGQFDLEKALRDKRISIEGLEGSKVMRVNWRSRQGKVLNALTSYNGNGTLAAVGSATGVATDTIFKVYGSGSVKFNLVASGDGIQTTNMSQVDLTNESTVADGFVWFYIPTAAALALITSVSAVWGNDLTTKYWTSVAQTLQADGTALKVGWNLLKFPWSTATQTGTNATTAFDSLKLTVAATGAIANLRFNKFVFAIGRMFDLKYYSKFLFKDHTAGTWMSRPVTNDDLVMLDEESLPGYLMELLKDMAHQVEGTDSAFDITYAEDQLKKIYPAYKGAYPSQVKKQTGRYGSMPFRGRGNPFGSRRF